MMRYLKAAFWASPEIPALGKVPVNLLAVLGFAILGLGNPGFWLLGLGLEAAYLFGLAGNRRFRKYVDAGEAQAARGQETADTGQTGRRILQELPGRTVQRFEALRDHCRDIQKIATHLREPDDLDTTASLEELQLAGLDRLLWIYLRLLFTQHMLERFFHKTGEAQIQKDIRNLEQ